MNKLKRIAIEVANLNLDIGLDATVTPLARRVKIQTADGVRELTHKELLLLLARRASVEADVIAGRKLRYKKCFAAECILLISVKNRGTCVKWCAYHKKKINQKRSLARNAKNREKIRARARTAKSLEQRRARYAKNRDKILKQQRARRAKKKAEAT